MTDATRMGGVRPTTHARLFVAKRREGRSRVSDDDLPYGYRLRLFALAAEIGVRAAWGLEALRPRERRRPRMPKRDSGTREPSMV